MSHTFHVRLVDEDGNPKRGMKVWAKESGIFGESGTEYTDDDGWVEFENSLLDEDKIISDVYIYVFEGFLRESHEFGPFDIEDGDSFSFTI
jgi:hypothetical protein